MFFSKKFPLFLYLFCQYWVSNGNIVPDHYALNQIETIQLAAVGRVAQLGELYDSRTDKFTTISLLKGDLPVIQPISNGATKSEYTMETSLKEKFNMLDISASLKLSILALSLELEGSGQYFKDTKKSAKSAKATLISSVTTEIEQLNILREDLKKEIDKDHLEFIDATHVVVGIQYGGNFFMSVEDKNENDEDQTKIEGSLGVKLEKFGVAIGGEGSVKFDDKEKNEMKSFKFEVYSDIVLKTNPQTIEEALEVMKNAPTLLLDYNKGKGKPMKYTLMPIGFIRQMLKIDTKLNSLSKSIDESIVESCIKLFDDINKVDQKLNDLLNDVKRFHNYLLSSKVKEVFNLSEEIMKYQIHIRGNLSTLIKSVRANFNDVTEINKFLTEAYKSPYAYGIINLDKFNDLKKEMRFINFLINNNATVFSKDISFDEYLARKRLNHEVYAFFFKEAFPSLADPAMFNFKQILEKKDTFGESAHFIAVKSDILNEKEKVIYFNFTGPTKLSLFRNSKLIIDDYTITSTKPIEESPELWSFQYMQKQLFYLKSQLQTNLVPLGYLYIQYPGKMSPNKIWPSFEWKDITSEYSGLFFRAEGGNSLGFEKEQDEASPRMTKQTFYRPKHSRIARAENFDYGNYDADQEPNITVSTIVKFDTKFTNEIRFFDSEKFSLTFSGDEVRPRNKAIRIWQRV